MAKKRDKQQESGGEIKPHRMSLKDIRGRVQHDTAIVKVPEWGIGPDGDAWEVIVRGLTVRDKHIVDQYARRNGLKEENTGYIVVALGCIDANGDLLFGETRGEAIEYVNQLPEKDIPVILRLFTEILRLTGQRGDANGQAVTANVAVEDAEKN